MTRLTDAERQELRRISARAHVEPPLSSQDRFVAPTPQARMRYIHWVTQASKFFKGEKPHPVDGPGWRL